MQLVFVFASPTPKSANVMLKRLLGAGEAIQSGFWRLLHFVRNDILGQTVMQTV
jgi:hypothetical protein